MRSATEGAGGIPEQEVGLRDMAGAFDLAGLGLFNGHELRVLDAEVHQRGRDAPVPLSGEFRFLLVQWRAGGDKGRKIQQLRDDGAQVGRRPSVSARDFRGRGPFVPGCEETDHLGAAFEDASGQEIAGRDLVGPGIEDERF